MKILNFVFLFIIVFLPARGFSGADIQKPSVYEGENVNGWVMSEKLDGIRGCWTGKEMVSRKGLKINCPPWFLENFPPFKLDGELWISRKNFEEVQSIVMDDKPGDGWKKVTYNIFEVPDASGGFLERLQKAAKWFSDHKNSNVKIIEQIRCSGKKDLFDFLNKIESLGGEGVVVKDPDLPYHTGRSPHVLKVKKFSDMEGTVIRVNAGKGKFFGLMGSLTLKLSDGKIFNLGTGFKDKERKNPPKVGDVVTFKYYGFTKNGIPKFTSFMRVRKD